MGREFDRRRVASATPVPPDPFLVKLVEALARAQARRDHAADLAARHEPQNRTADAPRSPVRPLQF